MPRAPVLSIDPFSSEFVIDPYPFHEELREAGPVVRLERYGVWAMARYNEVRTCLMNWEIFCSSAGVGLTNLRKEPSWRPPSIILEADPPLHSRTRAVLGRILSAAAMRKLATAFEQSAVVLIDQLVGRGEFDAVKDLAEVYPLKVFPDAIGLADQGREKLLPYGELALNASGPRNGPFEESLAKAAPILNWVTSSCTRTALTPESLGAQVYAAADAGEVTEVEASLLVRSLLTAGLHTSVASLGNALLCFAQHPDQWQLLRQNPLLARMAFDEVLRYESPAQKVFRTTTCPVEVAGLQLGEGEKVALFLGAANRDIRHWDNPHRFDITRRSGGHLAFGVGIHACVGMAVSRLEGEIVLSLLARKVEALELTGEPRRRLSNPLRGVGSLPIKVRPA